MKKKRTQSKGVLSYKKKRTKSKKRVSSYRKKRTKSKKRVSSYRKKRTVSKPRRKRTLRKSKGGAQSDDDYAFLGELDKDYQPQAQVAPEAVQSEGEEDDYAEIVQQSQPQAQVAPGAVQSEEDDGEELDISNIQIGLDDEVEDDGEELDISNIQSGLEDEEDDGEEDDGEEEVEVPRRGQYVDEEARNKATAKRGWSKVRSKIPSIVEEEEVEVPRRGQYVDEEARNKATAKRGWSKVRSKIPSIVEEEEVEVPRRGQYVDEEARNKATVKRGWSKVRSTVEQAESALAEAKILEEQERKTDEFVESLGAELPNRPYVDPDQGGEERIERARERARERHQQSLRERDEKIKDKEDSKKRDLAKKRWKGAIGSHVEAIGIEKEKEKERGLPYDLDLDRIEEQEQERKTDEFVESLGAELPERRPYVPPVPDLPNRPYVEPGQGESQPSTWSKFKSRFQGEEYEAFINRTGTELKELYLEYLTEYFQDIEEAEDLNILKSKYMSFIEKYYEIAIKNDKKLIELLK
jgi:hypothetical protein